MNITDDIIQRITPESGENDNENRSKTDYSENPKICTFLILGMSVPLKRFFILNSQVFLEGQTIKNKL